MFGLSKKERIAALEEKLSSAVDQARHFYQMKETSESNAAYELSKIAYEKEITATQAAKTDEGKHLLYEVVLNRQYAFYLNEKAIQLHAEIKRMKGNRNSNLLSQREWFDGIASPVGDFIVKDQVDTICGEVIKAADHLMR